MRVFFVRLLRGQQRSFENNCNFSKMEWSNDECLQLIDLYNEHEVLWNPKHPYYYSKAKKNEAWITISSAVDREEQGVRQKMASLLGSFRSQRSKGKRSIVTEKGTVELYVSKWFAFDRLRFLLDKDDPNNTIDSQCSIMDSTDTEFQQSDVVLKEEPLENEVVPFDAEQSNVSTSTSTGTPQSPSFKRKRQTEDPRIEESFRILKKASKSLEESPKEGLLDFYGRYIVSKMKKFSAQTQMVVEHEINNILYQADMGYYDKPTEILPSIE